MKDRAVVSEMQEKSFAFERKAAYLSAAMASGKVGPYWMAAAERIRRHLKAERSTQQSLASKADISEPTLSRFLDVRPNITKAPSLDEAARIAEALGWPPRELLDDLKMQRPPPEPPESGLLSEILELVERHRSPPKKKTRRAGSR